MKCLSFFNVLCLAPALLLLTSAPNEAADETNSKPNIVLIMADDMGWGDPGFNGGNKDLTPHIDRLAAQGMQLTQFYMHSVCSPSRAALLTGRYAFRNWMDWRSEDFGKFDYLKMLNIELPHLPNGDETRMIHALPTEEHTVAESLRAAGYFTAITGKWHCGEWLPEHLPMGQGFDYQYGHYAWGIDYTNYTIPHNAPARFAVYDWHRNQQPVAEQGYTTDLIANEVVHLLAQQKPDKPFFFYVPFNAIHGPLESIPRYTETYDKRQAALKCLDDAIGRIIGALDQYGFGNNTLVICTNDNGGLTEASNKPFRGTKNTTLEGGVRVPCVVRWPGHTKPGTRNNELMHVVDILPTFAALAGGPPTGTEPIDGLNMIEMLFHNKPSPRTEIVFEVSGSVRLPTIRSGDYKLMGKELYNIATDPSEQKNIADQHPDIVKTLSDRLAVLGKERPPLSKIIGKQPVLMDPALPYVYGQAENASAPEWVKEAVNKIRATQPKEWAPGTTPWPQAPKDGIIIYTGDGR